MPKNQNQMLSPAEQKLKELLSPEEFQEYMDGQGPEVQGATPLDIQIQAFREKHPGEDPARPSSAVANDKAVLDAQYVAPRPGRSMPVQYNPEWLAKMRREKLNALASMASRPVQPPPGPPYNSY